MGKSGYVGRIYAVLAFVDESGDTGIRRIGGTSRFFVVAVVIFQDNDAAQNCDDAIERLRRELDLPANYEFHYKENPAKIKVAFLRCISSHSFDYYVFAVDKALWRNSSSEFTNPEDLYKFSIGMALDSAKPVLDNARVVIDRRGDKRSRNELATYIRQRLREAGGRFPVRKVKVQRSDGNNLLQLADYVVGVANRSLRGIQQEESFRQRYLIRHEMSRKVWP